MAALADVAALFYLVDPRAYMYPGDDTRVVRAHARSRARPLGNRQYK